MKTKSLKRDKLDNLLHSYAMNVLKIGKMKNKNINDKFFLQEAREKTEKILLEKKEVITKIENLFKKELYLI